jgi:putative spermidine/putrescine transport system substrate-binding protein
MSVINRRKFLTVSATAVSTITSPAVAYAQIKKRFRVRVLGTHVTLQEPLRQRAQKELGIELVFEPGGSAAVLQKASSRPDSFDLYEQWSDSLQVLWRARAIQPIDTKRIRAWDEINSLTKTGRLTPDARIGLGDAPSKLLYVQPNGELGKNANNQVSFLPYVHNVDSFGYNADIVPEGTPYDSESWGWLFDPQWVGKVALVNSPTIGLFDAALAAQARGLVKFRDIGNITRDEMDKLFRAMLELKRQGHFRGVWTSVPQSVDLMEKGETVIQSMFSPGVTAVRGRGIPCIYAAPREGYRAWHGVMCLSAASSGPNRDAAYEYMNWWLSGWPGAFIARQGYYISNPQRSREHLLPSEWDYWYDGKPAAESLVGTDGRICVTKGERRRGGSYEERFSNVAVWNTVMDTYEYSLTRWHDFLLA